MDCHLEGMFSYRKDLRSTAVAWIARTVAL